jgi:hypothetical protein
MKGEQRCRFCRCTWEDGCPAGCSWVEVDLCSVCAAFKKQLETYIEHARRPPTRASLTRMLGEILVPFMGSPAVRNRKPRAAT